MLCYGSLASSTNRGRRLLALASASLKGPNVLQDIRCSSFMEGKGLRFGFPHASGPMLQTRLPRHEYSTRQFSLVASSQRLLSCWCSSSTVAPPFSLFTSAESSWFRLRLCWYAPCILIAVDTKGSLETRPFAFQGCTSDFR